MMHFVRTFLIMHAYGVKHIAIEEVQNLEKIVYIQNTYDNGWWEDVYPWPSSYPLDSPLAMCYRNHRKSGPTKHCKGLKHCKGRQRSSN